MTASMQQSERSELSWDHVAHGYDDYFAPRFAPYLGAAIGALLARRAELPLGAVLVPCVGPGHELCPLARALPDRRIMASDLSGEMVSLARRRSAGLPNVSVERADAMTLEAPSCGVAAVLSVFGLQLLPDPALALGSWLSLLAPGGLAVVVYWPRDTEPSGPFFSMRHLLRGAGVADGTWEDELSARALGAGSRVVDQMPLAFEIHHENAGVAWHGLTQLGPLRGLVLTRGQAEVDALGARFVAELPPGPLCHTPEARLLLLERR